MPEVRPIDANKLKKHPDMLLGVVPLIDAAPTLDYEPAVHAHWFLEREPDGSPYCFHCSNCDSDSHYIGIKTAYDFCPYCGAKMDEEVKE